jgi:hypothetical protein
MATLAKSGTPSLATYLPPASCQTAGLLAGEALAAGDACYIKSDGKIWRSNGTSANAAAKVDGFAAEACAVGEAVTLFYGVTFRYGAGMTPGARFYASATAGQLDDAATTGGTAPVAYAIDATRLAVLRSSY